MFPTSSSEHGCLHVGLATMDHACSAAHLTLMSGRCCGLQNYVTASGAPNSSRMPNLAMLNATEIKHCNGPNCWNNVIQIIEAFGSLVGEAFCGCGNVQIGFMLKPGFPMHWFWNVRRRNVWRNAQLKNAHVGVPIMNYVAHPA